MAVFGILPDPSDGAVAAVRTALEIRSRLAALNRTRTESGSGPVGYGVGIHTGEVTLGAIGIAERSDFTAVGDTVNTAARLEALTKTHVDAEADVLLTEETAHRLGSTGLVTRSLGTVPIRGRDRPVGIHVLERAT